MIRTHNDDCLYDDNIRVSEQGAYIKDRSIRLDLICQDVSKFSIFQSTFLHGERSPLYLKMPFSPVAFQSAKKFQTAQNVIAPLFT